MTADGAPARLKRADATRNGERLVLAAREVFARDGLSATLQDIARQAGVGVGTVYRNFASKQEIVETLYEEAVESALRDVREALRIEDPWEALVTFFEVTARNLATDRGLTDMLPGSSGVRPNERTSVRILDAVSPLFARAHAAGLLRPGIGATDILPIFAMLDTVSRLSEPHPELWRRYLAIMLDGLRNEDRAPLPAPGLDARAFGAALGGPA